MAKTKRCIAGSVDEFFAGLAGDDWRNTVINFPTDVFGITANILARTGAYLAVVSHY